MEDKQMVEKKRGKWRKILIWTVPSLVCVSLAIFLINFFGIPVGKTVQDLGNKIPYVNSIIPDPTPAPKKKLATKEENEWKEKYLSTSTQLKDRDQEIDELTKELGDAEKKLVELKKDNYELEQLLDEKKSKTAQKQMKQLVAIYTSIPAKKAAEMLSSLPLEDAAITISQLKTDQQSSILSSMKDAKKAAQISLLVKEIAGLSESEPIVLKALVHQIALQQENPQQLLSDTIAGMQPALAAGIIKSMMVTNSYTTIELLKNINTSNRAQILTEIHKIDANMAAQIAASLNG